MGKAYPMRIGYWPADTPTPESDTAGPSPAPLLPGQALDFPLAAIGWPTAGPLSSSSLGHDGSPHEKPQALWLSPPAVTPGMAGHVKDTAAAADGSADPHVGRASQPRPRKAPPAALAASSAAGRDGSDALQESLLSSDRLGSSDVPDAIHEVVGAGDRAPADCRGAGSCAAASADPASSSPFSGRPLSTPILGSSWPLRLPSTLPAGDPGLAPATGSGWPPGWKELPTTDRQASFFCGEEHLRF